MTDTRTQGESAAERDKVARFGRQISFHMEEIAKLCTPEMKITLLLRHPSNAQSCAILTDETKTDADAACETLRRLLLNPPRTMDL